MPIYNKLVRDHIPSIIESSGKSFEIRNLSKQEYMQEARKKLQEELNEYLETSNDEEAVDELADILELLYALSKQHGSSPEKLEEARAIKAKSRGGFEEKIFLVSVEDE
ncbi:nucleoside triphosphate pyrophosphohydrolase [Bacillus sp. FJAT-44742]|uniref:nucleoside triphosphate pyrophosphohydrolase n=1 Tax=Bacillus sp. FJAT-44742 TaxID=2014005 RepID=UPI000C2312AA|nr:nucleoside triphosphate pyrophosphohydrolase [Bacillus sp. FJAT-44742]